MIRIDIRPVWRFRIGDEERDFDFGLIAILAGLDVSAKLTHAADGAGISYRHAWNLIADWEEFFGSPLVAKSKGRGSRLTPLGRRLLWAGQRAQARLEPELDNLASEFAGALNESQHGLVVHASHDYAVAILRELSGDCGITLGLQYKGSFDAIAALRRGECDLAGFHVPEGPMGELMARRYAECLPLDAYRLISFATRTQGLIVRAGNPKEITGIADLLRPEVRMVNRQRGSGTRALFEFMVSSQGFDRARMKGYDDEEVTHGAVAALIAGGQADVGFGIQAAATRYRLDFIPVCRERYFLACRIGKLDDPAVQGLVAKLRGRAFRRAVEELAGYSVEGAGDIVESFDAAVHG